ncbi:MAG: Lrp/AsnC family transcriptional regulator, partial [Polaromonas sp.]
MLGHYPNMDHQIDTLDRKILAEMQIDASLSVDALSERVGLSRNACWRRIKQLEHARVLKARVALVDAAKVGCGLTVMVLIRTSTHDAKSMTGLTRAVQAMPEITGAYRMTGDLDYVLRVQVEDVPAYDAFYKRLISRVSVSDISASFVMEELKHTTAV